MWTSIASRQVRSLSIGARWLSTSLCCMINKSVSIAPIFAQMIDFYSFNYLTIFTIDLGRHFARQSHSLRAT